MLLISRICCVVRNSMDDLCKLRASSPDSVDDSIGTLEPEAYFSLQTRVPRRGAIINEIASMT